MELRLRQALTDAGIDGVGEGFASGRFRIGALGVLGVGLAAETDA